MNAHVQPDLLDWYPAHPGFKERGGTSQEAAEAIQPQSARLRNMVMAVLAGRQVTADEIATECGESILSIRPRVSELVRMGLVRKTGERRKNASGMSAAVWTLEVKP